MADPDPELAHARKSTELYVDILWKSFVQMADALTKGITFYFLIVVTSVGLIYQAKLPPAQAQVVAFLVIAVTVVVALLLVVAAWAILRVIRRIGSGLKSYNAQMFEQHAVERMIGHARVLGVAVVVLCISILAFIATATALILQP